MEGFTCVGRGRVRVRVRGAASDGREADAGRASMHLMPSGSTDRVPSPVLLTMIVAPAPR